MPESCAVRRGLAFLFPGQGGVPVLSPEVCFTRYGVREAYEALADPGVPHFEAFLQEIVADDASAQLGGYAMGMALLSVLRERGLSPDIVAGYSCGVYGGLVAAGMCSAEMGLAIVRQAGACIDAVEPGGAYAMAAVLGLTEAQVAGLLDALPGDAWISLVNNPTQILVGLEARDRAAFLAACTRAGAMKVIELPFSKPYHTPRLGEAARRLAVYLAGLGLDEPTLPMVLGSTPRLVGDAAEAVHAVAEQLWRTVYWHSVVRRLIEAGVEAFVCLDPSRVLGSMVRWITRQVPVFDCGDDRDLEALFSAFPAPLPAYDSGLAVRLDNPAP
jgi:[acyl-carrier-protein] S-malonyltransferase